MRGFTLAALLFAATAYGSLSSPSTLNSAHRRHHAKRAEASSDGWSIHKTLTGQDFIDFFNLYVALTILYILPLTRRRSDEKPSDNEGLAQYVDGVKEGLVYTDGDGKVRIGYVSPASIQLLLAFLPPSLVSRLRSGLTCARPFAWFPSKRSTPKTISCSSLTSNKCQVHVVLGQPSGYDFIFTLLPPLILTIFIDDRERKMAGHWRNRHR